MDDNKFNFNWSVFKFLIFFICGYFLNWYMVEICDVLDIFENKDFFYLFLKNMYLYVVYLSWFYCFFL